MAKGRPRWLGEQKKEIFSRCTKIKTVRGKSFLAVFTYGLKDFGHPELLLRSTAGMVNDVPFYVLKLFVKKILSGDKLRDRSELEIENLSKIFKISHKNYLLDGNQEEFFELS